MEIFLLLIVIILIIITRGLIADKNKLLLTEFNKIKAELQSLKSQINALQTPARQAEESKSEHKSIIPEQKKESKQESSTDAPIVIKESFTPPKPMFVVDVSPIDANASIENKTNAAPVEEEPVSIAPIYHTIEEPQHNVPPKKVKTQKSFLENNPDLEKFIGENLVNKIGIAILVLGIGYFVKYAIDKDWINELGRVAIGLLCGGILIGLAHYLRKEFTAFSSVLVGGGIAVLYFTISLAFHDYHLFSQTLAFTMMVIITAFAVMLSIAYDRIELAVLAIVGGFGSPFFVSTGQGNYIILFSYLLILNIGMLGLAYFKKWNLVNIISYAFTVLIFGGWLLTKYDNNLHHSALLVLLFALAFYMVFFAMNIVYNLKNKLPFQALEISLLLSNTFLFFSTGLYLLNNSQMHDYRGIFTIAMGLFNLGFAYPLYKRSDTDKNLIFMLIGLVLTFISLAAPIQLKGHNITLFWGAETVLLLWLAQKSGIKLIKQTSIIISALLLVSLLMDWSNNYNSTEKYLLPFANQAFVTGIFAVLALFTTLRFLNKEDDTSFNFAFISLKEYKNSLQIAVSVVLYLVFLLELVHQIQYYYNNDAVRNIMVICYHLSYILLLFYVAKKQNFPQFNIIKIALLCLSILMVLLCNAYIIDVRNEIIKYRAPLQLFFFLHFYIIIIGFYFIYTLHQSLKILLNGEETKMKYFYWLTVALLIVVASMELDHLVVYTLFDKQNAIHQLLTQSHKFGYAILWGAFAFVLINIGMKRKIREIRIISLALFTLVILKLFIYDINNISEAGKIVAFILLGVLLLVVSFMYQRLKKLIAADNESNNKQNNSEDEA